MIIPLRFICTSQARLLCRYKTCKQGDPMIICRSGENNFESVFSDSQHEGIADTTADKGGNGAGFRPHDLLEAAFATCLNIALRMRAQKLNIPLSQATTIVTLDRSSPRETIFKYSIELGDNISPHQRNQLLSETATCAVRQTLLKKLSFTQVER
jgi:putative redox protein